MNTARLAILAEITAETAAILDGSLSLRLAGHEVTAIQLELAQPFEAGHEFRIYGHRRDDSAIWMIALAKACRAKRAARLAAHFSRVALAA